MVELDGSEGWEGVLENLELRRRASRAMGGDERLRKHREAGKLDARARIDHLLDPESFQELGTLVGKTTDRAILTISPRNLNMIREGQPDGQRPPVM